MVEEQAGAFDPEPAPKFCKDCKWIMANTVTPSVLINSVCAHSSAVRPTNLVTGETPHNQFCEARRINGCGPEGKNWEAK